MKKILLQLYAVIMFSTGCTFLFSCSEESPVCITAPESTSQYPVTFIARIESPADNRTTTGGSWTGNELISVSLGNTIKQYRVSPEGRLTCTDPFYWQNSNPAKVTAWYPYSTELPSTFTVKTDQSGTGYDESDMLMACSTVAPEKPLLGFTHLPAKIIINIKGDENTGDISSATVYIIDVAVTSGTVAADTPGTITVEKSGLPGNMTVIPQVIQPEPGYDKTVQALLVPQTKDNTRFIRISFNGKDFYYTPSTGEADISTGCIYTYNIVVRGQQKTIQAGSYRSAMPHR